MKKELKGFVCGVLTTALVAGGAAFAAGQWKTIDVLENDITVMVDGQQVTESNFVYNDRTYLPLRAVAEAVGKSVDYDETTNTAYIGNKVESPQISLIYNKGPFTINNRTSTVNINSIDFKLDENYVNDKEVKINFTFIGNVPDYNFCKFNVQCYDKDGFMVYSYPVLDSVTQGENFKLEDYFYAPNSVVRIECVPSN